MELQQTTHSSGVKIKVIVGDMTSHKVDAIVNAANANLAHVGGLAQAIVDKGKILKIEKNLCHSKKSQWFDMGMKPKLFIW